jgi:hypothetical protein
LGINYNGLKGLKKDCHGFGGPSINYHGPWAKITMNSTIFLKTTIYLK